MANSGQGLDDQMEQVDLTAALLNDFGEGDLQHSNAMDVDEPPAEEPPSTAHSDGNNDSASRVDESGADDGVNDHVDADIDNMVPSVSDLSSHGRPGRLVDSDAQSGLTDVSDEYSDSDESFNETLGECWSEICPDRCQEEYEALRLKLKLLWHRHAMISHALVEHRTTIKDLGKTKKKLTDENKDLKAALQRRNTLHTQVVSQSLIDFRAIAYFRHTEMARVY